jgi:hypothetical protein
MTVDDACGDSEIEWRAVPQIHSKTGISQDYYSVVFSTLVCMLLYPEEGGMPAVIEHMQKKPLKTYQEYIQYSETKESEAYKKKIKHIDAINEKNKYGIKRIDEIVGEINEAAKTADLSKIQPIDKSIREKITDGFKEAYTIVYGHTPDDWRNI